MTLEAILIMALLLAGTIAITRWARNEKIVATLVEGPWLPIQGMIESGVWARPDEARELHPNLMRRHGTAKGEAP